MTEPVPETAPLPEGDDNPDRLFAAVGHALFRWEQMEAALATLYTICIGKPRQSDALADYGSTHRKFVDRMNALFIVTNTFFIQRPNQENEGKVACFIGRALSLSIERHRIAHGMLNVVPAYDPALADPDGSVGPSGPTYFWGAPFYATKSLRTNWLGNGSRHIDSVAAKFVELANDVSAFNQHISPES